MRGHHAALDVQGRLRRAAAAASAAAASATRTRSTVAAVAVLRRPAVGATSPTGSASSRRTTTRAQRMLGVVVHDARRPGRPAAAGVRRASWASATRTARRASASTSARPGKTVPGPLLRRRGARPHRLHRLRALHGRLPGRREEHAGEELPVARRAARGATVRPTARSSTSARSAPRTAADGYAVTSARSGMRLRKRPPHAHRRAASSSPPARSAPTAAAALPAERLAAARLRTASASSCARTASRSSPSRCPRTTRRT